MHVPRSPRLTVLCGNGLTIAVRPDLALSEITRESMARLRADKPGVAAYITEIAEKQSGRPVGDDFEILVGAFGTLGDMIDQLAGLASHLAVLMGEDFSRSAATARGLVRSAYFARRVRDYGISVVLEVIAERSIAHEETRRLLDPLVGEILREFPGEVTMANLNYDALLLASLVHGPHKDETCDMGHGFRNGVFRTSDGATHTVRSLRTSSDFPTTRRVRLLHLHGSLGFWTNRTGVGFKLPLELIRTYNPFHQIRTTNTPLRPAVVLANQTDKSTIVKRQPFALAYEGFAESLKESEHLLIVGYSFRDACVNEQLAIALQIRLLTQKPIKVLVVTYEDDLTEQTVLSAFRHGSWLGSTNWLTINRGGALAFTGSADWARFMDADPLAGSAA
jgi:SIR2-like domain